MQSLITLSTPQVSTRPSGLTADELILLMIDGAGKLDSASWHFLDLVYCALLEEASRQNGHHQQRSRGCARLASLSSMEFSNAPLS